ncbi:MAG TPA: hypothetical protein VG028_04660 [Terriglobia bacterium]|nr:hypothetical protein [Terriglobia bacterium]
MKFNHRAHQKIIFTLALAWTTCMTAVNVRATSLPPGTQIQVRVNDKLDTGVVRPGQAFSGIVTEPVVVNGRTLIPAGARASGRVIQAVSSGRLKKPATITLELTQAGGRAISTATVSIDGKSHLLRNAEFIGGGTAAGAIIGAIMGGTKGAAIGAATGAGAGTVGAFLTGKKEIVIPAETVLPFVVPGGNESPVPNTANGRQPTYPAPASAYPPPPPSQSYYPPARGGYPGGSYSQPYFSDGDQRLVRRYYSNDYSNLPPGLAKRGGNLPPGLERQVERNGTLPPGLQRRVEPFPADLNRQMPQLPPGCSRVFLGDRAMIIDRNNRVLDVMSIGQGEDDQGGGHGRGRGHGHGRGHDDNDRD